MKTGYSITYFNNVFSFQNDYMFLRIINNTETNEVHCVWWYEDDYKHNGTIGQWRVKSIRRK